jgi:hypothetical protein
VVADDLDHRLHRIGRLDGPSQAAPRAQSGKREYLGQPLAERRSRARPLVGETSCKSLQEGLGSDRIRFGPGRPEAPLYERPLDLGQVCSRTLRSLWFLCRRRHNRHQRRDVVIVSRPSWLGDQEALTYWGLADLLARLSSQLRFECPDQWWPVWSFTKGPRTGPLAPV